ncbi:MAG: FapA family protein [Oscillospiraceae bacterium]|jgi:uncharacterized protein (DUF342 family)|nr:FapA family protein [Oscillospiraceae bacterium]
MDVITQQNEPLPEDAIAEVFLSADRMNAYAKITPPQHGGERITLEDLKNALAKTGVVYGIDEGRLISLVTSPVYDSLELIATGKPPLEGKHGWIETHFTATKDKKPALREDGTVDYKSLTHIENVRVGTELCTLHPPVPGTPGSDVRGAVLQPRAVKPAKLVGGKGTALNEDKSKLCAAIDGFVDNTGGRVSVLAAFSVKEDVDVSTGNITFVGHVNINGSVQTGFTVRADGNVNVGGSVEGGSIYAGGSILISGGYNGKDGSELAAGGDIRCKYINQGKASAENNIHSGTILGSSVTCGGSVFISGGRGAVIGGRVSAGRNIECLVAGARLAGAETTLEAGNDIRATIRNKQIPNEEKEAAAALASAERLAAVLLGLRQQGRLPPARIPELEKLLAAIADSRDKLAGLAAEKEDIARRLQTSGYGNVTVKNTAYPGVVIIIGSETMKINTDVQFTCFTRDKDGIHMRPAQ